MNLYYSLHKLKIRLLEGRKVSGYEVARRLSLKRRLTLQGTQVIGITGSGAKSTTSALLFHLLSGSQRSALSFIENTADRMAMRIASFPRGVRFGVFEMSGHAPGVIDQACAVVQPDVAIVTVVASDHRTNFSGAEAIAQEKGTLVQRAVERGGIALLNADDPLVRGMQARAKGKALLYGESADADYRAVDVHHSPEGHLRFTCQHGAECAQFEIGLLGRHMLVPAMASIACAHQMGISLEQLALRGRSYIQLPGRCSLHVVRQGPTFICDSIKAPFATLELSFAQLALFPEAPRRTLVLGKVSDYAGAEGNRYRQIYKLARKYADRVIVLGHGQLSLAPQPGEKWGEQLVQVDTVVQLRQLLIESCLPGEVVLLKGSRRVNRLDRIVLDHERQVDCWIDRCSKATSCFECSDLGPGGAALKRPRGLITDAEYFIARSPAH